MERSLSGNDCAVSRTIPYRVLHLSAMGTHMLVDPYIPCTRNYVGRYSILA
jgi:hypothetical protein